MSAMDIIEQQQGDIDRLRAEVGRLRDALRWFVDYHDNPAQMVVTFDEYMAKARAALGAK